MGRIYIVYGQNNQNAARKLRDALRAAGHTVWLENAHQSPAPAQREQLYRALQRSQIMVVLLSPQAIQSLRLRLTLSAARELGQPLLPILVEPVSGLAAGKYIDATRNLDAAVARVVGIVNRRLTPPATLNTVELRYVAATLAVFVLVVLLLAAIILSATPPVEVAQAVTETVSPTATRPTATATSTPTITSTSSPSPTNTPYTPSPTASNTPIPDTPTPPSALFAAFSASPLQGNAPLTVNFVNESEGDIAGYAWDFTGDDITDSANPAPPPVTYNTPGIYAITLIVAGPGGESESATASIVVYGSASSPLNAAFTANPTTGSAPLTVRFTNQSVGNITGYAWDFDGNGIVDSSDANPASFTYTSPGTYIASLVVSNASGPSRPATTTITVTAANAVTNGGPVADFSADPPDGDAPLTVSFTNWSRGNITAYAWDFDDDGVVDSTSANPPPFTYNEPGDYDASLTVSGPGGQSVPDRITIQVYEYIPDAPISDFTAQPTSGPAPLIVTFTDKSTGEAEIVAWEWDFNGDGIIDSTAANPPAYTYTTPGTYNAWLLACDDYGDDYGEGEPKTLTITVYSPASATPTQTLTPTLTGTTTPTVTPTNTPTFTPTRTPTLTPSPTPTTSGTPTPSEIPTFTPTDTPSPTETPTSSPTEPPSPAATPEPATESTEESGTP